MQRQRNDGRMNIVRAGTHCSRNRDQGILPAGTMLGLLGSHEMDETNPGTKLVRKERNGNGTNGVTLIEGVRGEERALKRPIDILVVKNWRASDSP
jgi:hypothetical protein